MGAKDIRGWNQASERALPNNRRLPKNSLSCPKTQLQNIIQDRRGQNILPKYIRNTGKEWTPAEVKQLKQLAKGYTPTPVIGLN
jgi:hypothetical protein